MSNNNDQKKSFWKRLNTEQGLRYALILLIGLFGGWIASNFYNALFIYPYIGHRYNPYDPNGNGGNGDTTTTTIPIITTTTTPVSGQFILVAFDEAPHIGKMLIHGGVGSRPITEIYFRMRIRETTGIAGTCYVDCSVETTGGKELGGVGSIQVEASQTLDHSFTFTIDSSDYDLIDWTTATATIVTGG